ncbi:MAG: hypothetical protein IIZ42_05365 [Eubacterium sp.]|nr:hypothetical protein [Eubacterium sp.]
MSIFDKSDLDSLKAAQAAEQKAREEAEQKDAEDGAVIREALNFALASYAEALRELPEAAKESGLDYVKFDTGFRHPEKRRLPDESRTTLLRKSYRFADGVASYFAATDGTIEKHWKENGPEDSAKCAVRECSVEEFLDAFGRILSGTKISAARGGLEKQLPEGLGTLGKLTFKKYEEFESGISNFYFRSGFSARDAVTGSIKNKGETVRAVKELILWCLSGESADSWAEKQ